jgi:hypothetical protein
MEVDDLRSGINRRRNLRFSGPMLRYGPLCVKSALFCSHELGTTQWIASHEPTC